MSLSLLDAYILANGLKGPGWTPGDNYFRKSTIITSVAGSTPGAAPTIANIISDLVPPGLLAVITDLYLYHIDGVGLDYLTWRITKNGMELPPYNGILGSPSTGLIPVPVNIFIDGGSRVNLDVSNFSGTDPTDTIFPPAVTTRVGAAWSGFLFSRPN